LTLPIFFEYGIILAFLPKSELVPLKTGNFLYPYPLLRIFKFETPPLALRDVVVYCNTSHSSEVYEVFCVDSFKLILNVVEPIPETVYDPLHLLSINVIEDACMTSVSFSKGDPFSTNA
jgi:hypothetical protein